MTADSTNEANGGKVIKRVVATNAAGEKFRLIVRARADGIRILAEDVPTSLSAASRSLLESRTRGAIAPADIQEQWRSLLEALQSDGWTVSEEFQFTLEISDHDDLIVSRLNSPDAPSEQLADLHRSLHGRMAAMFSKASHNFAAEIVRLTRDGRHADAFSALERAEEASVFVGGPNREMVDAICTIDRSVLSRADAFKLWGRRVDEKSRGRFYDGLEQDLDVLEQDYADELAAHAGWPNVHLLIRAQAAEYTNRPELAYARYRELAGRTPLEAVHRAHANWGLFRLSEPGDTNAVPHAELAGDAFLEDGDRLQAVHCYAAGADLCEQHDRVRALDLLNRALAVLDTKSSRSNEYRARILHTRASLQMEWRKLPEAWADAVASVDIRRGLTGVEDSLMASLLLARHIAEALGKAEDVARLDTEIAALRPKLGSATRLRERVALGISEGVEEQRRLHEEVLKLDDPKLTAESLLALGMATMATSLPDALRSLEAGLEIAERAARLRRDLDLRALLEAAIGQAYCTHGDELRAIPWFSRAVAHNPRVELARNNLAALLLKHKRFGELAAVLETQLRVYGELPGLLCIYGQALLGLGRPQAAIRTLLRAREVCRDPKKMEAIEEWLRKAQAEPPELDTTWTTVPPKRAMTQEEFSAVLDSFAKFIRTERRMSFWRMENKVRRFVQKPEQHGKVLLHTFLRAKLGDGVTILEELPAGAGILDLWAEIPGGMRLVIELKMCGVSYGASYAAEGVDQLAHYMDNKGSHVGYLILFDARRRDFGKGLEPQLQRGSSVIGVRFVDIRPDVTAGRRPKRSAARSKK